MSGGTSALARHVHRLALAFRSLIPLDFLASLFQLQLTIYLAFLLKGEEAAHLAGKYTSVWVPGAAKSTYIVGADCTIIWVPGSA